MRFDLPWVPDSFEKENERSFSFSCESGSQGCFDYTFKHDLQVFLFNIILFCISKSLSNKMTSENVRE